VAGIFFEISFGAVIRDNVIENDGEGGAGIVLNTSSDAEIYGNQITNCAQGILAIQSNRGVSDWTKRTYALKNLNVHDNAITQRSGMAAGIQAGAAFAPEVFTSWNNRFLNNTYRFSDLGGQHFEWMRGARGIDEWKAYHNDASGRFIKL
jgi:nitrous oxidase accessory protein NosD